MPTQIFQLDRTEIDRLAKLYKRMPRQFGQASARMLNSFAFGTRVKALQIIQRRMIVRNPRFVKGSIRVRMARGSQPLVKQESIIGSLKRQRFSGWAEQETGKATDRTRVATLFARGDDRRKQVRPSLRMKSGLQFLSADDFAGKTAAHRVIVMLHILERRQHRRPFIIRGHRKFKPGLYQFRRRKLHMVQSFEPGNTQPRRIRWLTGARREFFRDANIRELWTDNLNRTLKRSKSK